MPIRQDDEDLKCFAIALFDGDQTDFITRGKISEIAVVVCLNRLISRTSSTSLGGGLVCFASRVIGP